MEGIERDQTLLPCPFCGAAAEHGSPDRYTDGPRKRMMKARDGIEAQHGLNDVYPGDDYPAPPFQVSPDAAVYLGTVAKMDRDALVAEFESIYRNFLYWRDRCERRTKERDAAQSQVSPDAKAIEQARGVLVRYRGDIATWQYGDLVGDIAAALTAATMREREACALVANAVGEIFDRLGDGAGATVADGIRDAIRARSIYPKGAE